MHFRCVRKTAQALVALLCAVPAFGSCEGAEAQLSAAKAAFSQGRFPTAESLLSSLAKTHPNCVEALLPYGQILAMKGQAAEAEEVLTKASGLAPDNPEAHFQLGAFYDGRQQNAKAAAQFERVIALSPQDPRAWDYWALNLEPMGQTDKADWAYRKGLEVNRGPNFDSFLDYNYGRFLMKQNRLEEAAAHLNRAVELAPTTRAVYYERAKLNLKLEKPQLARRDAEQALNLEDPGGVILDLQLYYLLSRVYSRLGEHDLAQKYIKLSQTTSVPLKARGR